MVAQALVLHAMGRVWICSCGTIRLWVGDIWSSELSQQLTDWYTASHIVHGILFYGLLRLLLPRAPVLARLAIAVGIEAAWRGWRKLGSSIASSEISTPTSRQPSGRRNVDRSAK